MTEPAIPDTLRTTGYNPIHAGCTFPGCGVQDTVTCCGRLGRRCADHPPVFDPEHAVALMTVDLGAAVDYCRTGLAL
jgi:hypothetical protein